MVVIPLETIETFRADCAGLYPLAAVFFTPTEWENHRKFCMDEAVSTAIDGAYPKPDETASNPNVENNTVGDAIDVVSDKLGSVSLKETLNGQEPAKQQTQKNKTKKGKRGGNVVPMVAAKATA